MTFITGPENIEHARWLAVRSALRLEVRGFKKRGRSALQLANEITGKRDKNASAAYESLNAHIVAAMGEDFNRTLVR